METYVFTGNDRVVWECKAPSLDHAIYNFGNNFPKYKNSNMPINVTKVSSAGDTCLIMVIFDFDKNYDWFNVTKQ